MYTKEDLERKACETIFRTPGFEEAYELARRISKEGKVYAIGGVVYQNIVNGLRRGHVEIKDLDFLTVNPLDLNGNYGEWNLTKNSFGQPKFRNNGWTLDIVSLGEILHIKENELKEDISGYLEGCPLNIQMILFDVEEKRLEGEGGIKAINEGIVKVNNMLALERYCRYKGYSPVGYIMHKSRSLAFDAEF